LHAEPVVPALLIGLQQEPQVVDLEALGAALVARLKPRDAPADLAELQFFGVAGEGLAGRVEGDPGSRSLIVVYRVALGGRDRG
jgi:hypothetical protein